MSDSDPQPWQVAFNKVRTQTTAGVAAVRRPATLLVAIEATLAPSSQGSATTTPTTGVVPPAAYLAALVSTLIQLAGDPEAAKETGEKRQLLEATLYLLSILSPHLEATTLRPQVMTIVPTLPPLFTSFMGHAPAVKSLLAIGQAALSILSLSVLEKDLHVRTTYAAILSLCEDARPKVRRRAQEAVQELLKKPPPPSTVHPYMTESANWILNKLQDAVKGAKRGGKKEANAPAVQVGQGQKKAQMIAKEVGGIEHEASGGAGDESRAIALLTFVRNLGNAWSDEATPSLLPILLSTLTLSSQHLTLAALTLLSHLFSASRSADSLSSNSVQETLLALLDAKPRGGSGETNEKLLAGWVEGVGEGLVAFARTNPELAQTQAVKTFKEVLPILSTAQSPALRTATEAACEMVIRHCLLDRDVLAAVEVVRKKGTNGDVELQGTKEGQATLTVVQVLEKAITSPRFAAAAQPHVLALAKALFLRLRVRIPSATDSAQADPAASILLRKTLFLLSKLREDSHFEWKRALEDVLDAAIKVCGPESVLAVLPLGLEEGANPAKAKAWLLPLLKPAITNTRLAHFKTTFVPLSAELFAKAEKAKEAQRGMEAKVWETLVGQVWALLPGYCEYAVDLVRQVDVEFLGLVANVVYAQPMLRPAVFKALSTLVGTTKTLAQSTSPSELLYAQFGLTPQEGKKALSHLQGLAETVLGISFNVYGKMARGEGGYILSTVGEWLAILPERELVATFERVKGLLKQALEAQPRFTATNKASMQKDESGVISPIHALLDILITMIPYAAPFEKSFFDLAMGDELLKAEDAAVQKKAYRILARLAEERGGNVLEGRVGHVLESLVEDKSGVAQGAKRDRVLLLSTLVPLLPSDSLHHIPSLIPEAVLGTKESNERTREAAYELVVGMATKMQQGGTLARHKVKGMRDEHVEGNEGAEGMEEDDVPASVEEFVTMLSAGLAGLSPHMISATITSLSRVIFEFHAHIPDRTLRQVVETLVVFLSSPNREIVRSALGFIKVCLVVLEGSLLEPSLPRLVPNLINWSHEHSNHFKVKVRHLLERLMRKFGHEKVERYAPEEDRKLVANLRKKMMRSKKKKAAAAAQQARGEDDDGSEVEAAPRANPRSAYDEVLYGSDSDASSAASDNEQAPSTIDPTQTAPSGVKNRKSQMRKQKQRDEGTFIHEDADEVLDLLDDRMMSNISAGQGIKGKKERKDLERHFKTDQKSGRMRFDEEGEKEVGGEVRMRDQEAEVGGEASSSMGAYLEAMRGEDGHTLDAKGKAKFNKTQGKRARSGEFDDDDVHMDDGTEVGAKRKKKGGPSSRETVRVGHEFKAKRAGGDVKKNGMEPYAFVPLQAVAGKKAKGGPKIGLTGLKRAGGGKRS
ncbi:BZ3500_MvSof-1268-A1-R1_Chr8-1g09735 [Microbotryum saponariae]|uniref:BZ3500_MvSof-1268-A1-R1_Chr8-1g09735 protein n=1 Tax=Microbotryum saponariae TaxID=289078 RepID=A0A2X0MUD6_9BASI|nr:BZ3500_MvSof-1268-A1-R1_Chr8-1g09735 [Microbotryum saponariae]SDA08021.1 BZ3501_MvSof-1269-A2-R1_Chr8-1g09458 [Microbotryum saponariae]